MALTGDQLRWQGVVRPELGGLWLADCGLLHGVAEMCRGTACIFPLFAMVWAVGGLTVAKRGGIVFAGRIRR